jgi:putative beta barrel porin BBP7
MNLRQHFIAPLLVISLTSLVSSSWAADQPSPVLKGPPKAVANTGNFWGELEFLYWQTKGDKLPALVTSGGTGAIGAAGTSVLFGNSTVNEDWRPGGRIKAGYWFDSSHTSGVEAHFFGLADTSTRFNAASGGTPLLARPFFNTVINAQDALLIAAPGIVSGQVSASETSRLFGLGAD